MMKNGTPTDPATHLAAKGRPPAHDPDLAARRLATAERTKADRLHAALRSALLDGSDDRRYAATGAALGRLWAVMS